MKILCLDLVSRMATIMLIKMQPGAAVPLHKHTSTGQICMLEGLQEIEGIAISAASCSDLAARRFLTEA